MEHEDTRRLRELEKEFAVMQSQFTDLKRRQENLNSGINRGLWILGGGFLAAVVAWVAGGGLVK